jgi:hypothetical protein
LRASPPEKDTTKAERQSSGQQGLSAGPSCLHNRIYWSETFRPENGPVPDCPETVAAVAIDREMTNLVDEKPGKSAFLGLDLRRRVLPCLV